MNPGVKALPEQEAVPPSGLPAAPPSPTAEPADQPKKQRFLLSTKPYSKKSFLGFIFLFGLVGGAGLYLALAGTGTGIKYFWANQYYDATYWDGQVHTKKAECLANSFICHGNGQLIIAGSASRKWESDPSKNSPSVLKNPTWYGPYNYSPGPFNSYGYGITGLQQTCFMIKDVTGSKASARVVFQIQNAADGAYPAQTLKTLDGKLGPVYKQGFVPVCIVYTNPHDAYKQQYAIYVRSGKVQIDYVDHMYEYYINDYNPYPYYYVVASVQAKASPAQQRTTLYVCGADLKKSAGKCLSKDDLAKANAEANSNLTELMVDPAVTYGE